MLCCRDELTYNIRDKHLVDTLAALDQNLQKDGVERPILWYGRTTAMCEMQELQTWAGPEERSIRDSCAENALAKTR